MYRTSMGKDIVEKKKKSWTALTVMNDVKARLDKARADLEKKVGVELSWSKFFSLLLDERETHVVNGKK
jgi:hypothetical protein